MSPAVVPPKSIVVLVTGSTKPTRMLSPATGWVLSNQFESAVKAEDVPPTQTLEAAKTGIESKGTNKNAAPLVVARTFLVLILCDEVAGRGRRVGTVA